MTMKNEESKLQSACVKWFNNSFHDHRKLSIPNGGKRGIKTAITMKREGCVAGVPDLCLPVARGGYHALYIEMKSEKGRLSPDQKAMSLYLTEQGNKVIVCRSVTQFIHEVSEYLKS